MIWYLDSAHQNSWKTLSFSNSYAHTHQKLITDQLYSSDKMMVQLRKTLIIYCLLIFHSTKSKNVLILGFSISKQLENTLSVIHMLTHTSETNHQPTLQQWQNHQVWKTLSIYCLKIFHSTKSKNDLIFGFSTLKQLENTLFQ